MILPTYIEIAACTAWECVSLTIMMWYVRSADKPKSQANWKAKYSLTYTLLSDPSYQVCCMLTERA